jgi:hypothetical protein
VAIHSIRSVHFVRAVKQAGGGQGMMIGHDRKSLNGVVSIIEDDMSISTTKTE